MQDATLHAPALFSERQYFRKSVLGIGLIAITTLLPLGMLGYILSSTDMNLPTYLPIMLLLMPLLSIGLILWMNLETHLHSNGIRYRFHGWHFSMHHIDWNNVKYCYTRVYRPMWEYGGWGIRWRIGKGRAFNVMGNQGLQIVLNDGSRILFGTQKMSEIEKILKEIGQWKPEKM